MESKKRAFEKKESLKLCLTKSQRMLELNEETKKSSIIQISCIFMNVHCKDCGMISRPADFMDKIWLYQNTIPI